MGGCCCCSSRRAALNRTPVYLYCPRASEEREPLSSAHVTTSVISPGLFVLTNLETSSPDTYQAPPAPLPYDVGTLSSQTLSSGFETSDNKSDSKAPSEPQPQGEDDLGKGCPKAVEDNPSTLSAYINSSTEEEDVCPTCLEEYDTQNPRIIAKCEHHFHLSCILEWMERSDTCPICDQIMVIDHTFYE